MIEDSYKQQGLRNNLVRELKNKGIHNEKVLTAIGTMPRHIFFDKALQMHAYKDKAFPIGEDQTISQPYTVAFQTQALNILSRDKVLEIGTGSGYQSCILHLVGAKVFTIERQKKLFEKTELLFQRLRYSIKGFYGDGTKGLPQYAPYDKIIVTAGAPDIPYKLLDQLKVGGRLIIPIGNEENQMMYLFEKKEKNQITRTNLGKFSFVPLIGEEGW